MEISEQTTSYSDLAFFTEPELEQEVFNHFLSTARDSHILANIRFGMVDGLLTVAARHFMPELKGIIENCLTEACEWVALTKQTEIEAAQMKQDVKKAKIELVSKAFGIPVRKTASQSARSSHETQIQNSGLKRLVLPDY
jgi:hypothetical protein